MELNLDLSLNYLPKNLSDILQQVSICKNDDDKLVILDDYVKRLQDELNKIQAFKRELPLSIIILNDVIERLKDELKKFSDACNEKKEWMSSAQLWTANKINSRVEQRLRVEEHEDRSVSENPIREKQREDVFVPVELSSGCTRKENGKEGSPVPNLSLMTPMLDLDSCRKSCGNEFVLQTRTYQQLQQQGFRKQRRCWSPELHRRFVEALQQLGGSQAATPKQIRELMQVDGLTNDEVKSHLQKYRLHIRRLPASSSDPTTGLWTAQDCNGNHPKANISQSNSPQGPLPTGGSDKGISSAGDDSIDTEEDERSEVRSWKAVIHKAV